MEHDYYDEDLPEVKPSWAESLNASRSTMVLVSKLLAIPTGLCILSCITVALANKKIGSL